MSACQYWSLTGDVIIPENSCHPKAVRRKRKIHKAGHFDLKCRFFFIMLYALRVLKILTYIYTMEYY